MVNQKQRPSRRPSTLLWAVLFLSGVLGGVACKSESSVMEDAPSNTTEGAKEEKANAVEAPTPAASMEAAPAASSGAGEGSARAFDSSGKQLDLPFQVTPAKPALTPAPDPFPARPTPKVVVVDGKIVQEWQAPEEALALVNPVKGQADAVANGREWYLQRCADCHGKEGKGNGWLSKGVFKPPTNLASQMVQANSDGELYWKITNGKSPMPASRIRFTDEQRWEIVTYLRTFKP
jgi:mono/diheme cytochrome c family protein